MRRSNAGASIGVVTALVAVLVLLPATPAAAATVTWDGGGVDANWSTAANWVGDAAPVANDDLVFPAGAARVAMNNDLAFAFDSMTFEAPGYFVGGNQLRLNSSLDVTHGTGTTTLASRLIPAFAQLDINVPASALLDLDQGLDLNGLPVRFAGAGTAELATVLDASVSTGSLEVAGPGVVSIAGANAAEGSTTVTGGTFLLDGSAPPANVTIVEDAATLSGSGTFGEVNAGGIVDPGRPNAPGRLTAANVTLDNGSSDPGVLRVDVGGTAAASGYDQLTATGTVDLASSQLVVVTGSFQPPAGSTYTLVDNTGGSPVTGTFAGLAEGALFTANGTRFRITYAGGTGNDVVITVVQELAFAVATAAVSEEAGVAHVVVSRTGGTGGAVSVAFATANGTAVAGSDYNTASGTLSFAAGETAKVIDVPVIDDPLEEANETFTVTLSAPGGGANLGAPTAHTATIIDDDILTDGYWMAGADGGVFAFGEARFRGSAADVPLQQPIVDVVGRAAGEGYWLVAADGGVFTFGDARFHGSAGDIRLNAPIVAAERTPDGEGYWLAAADGGVFTYGTAGFFGSAGGVPLQRPVVDIIATESGNGYWLIAADGGVFTYGDAVFHGSTGDLTLNAPVTAAVRTLSGAGYWLVASDGGVFTYGDARFHGSTGGQALNAPIVGAAGSRGDGYRLIAADGGVFTFGDAPFRGSTGDLRLNAPVVGGAIPG